MEISQSIKHACNIKNKTNSNLSKVQQEKAENIPTQEKYSSYPNAALLKAMYVSPNNNNKESSHKPLQSYSFFNKLDKDNAECLNELLQRNDKNSSNIQSLINLIESGDVDYHCLNNISRQSELQKNMVDDIKLVQQAKENNTPIEDAVVPAFASKKEAYFNTKDGDVYTVGDEKNIYYRCNNQQYSLKIDKETYIKLFPPIERYSMKQQELGDCYLVSTLDALYQDKNTRLTVLRCFEQDGNDVNVKLPNDDRIFNIKNCKLENSTEIKQEKYIKGAEGIKILEYAFGQVRKESYINQAKVQTWDSLDNAYNKLDEAEQKVQTKQNTINAVEQLKKDLQAYEAVEEKNDFVNAKIEKLRLKINSLEQGISTTDYQIAKPNQDFANTIFKINLTNKEDLFEEMKNSDDIWVKKGTNTGLKFDSAKRIVDAKISIAQNKFGVEFVSDKEKKKELKELYGENANYYREAGFQPEVFVKFNMKSRIYNDFDAVKNQMKNDLYQGSSVIIEGAAKNELDRSLIKEKSILQRHAYNITVELDDNNEYIYKAINPYNTAFSTTLSEDEIKEYFQAFTYYSK